MKFLLTSSFILCFSISVLFGQENPVQRDSVQMSFDLGEIVLIGERNPVFSLEIDYETLRQPQYATASKLIETLPGVSLIQVGAKNESMLSVRGFDLRQIPVYMDGVPVYLTYDGYTDLSAFLISDLSKISVSKGDASVLLGPNNMGGAINMLSRKPSASFEADATAGVYLDRSGWGGWQSSMNVGGAHKKFYYQAGLAQQDIDDFVPSSQNSTLSEGLRYNSAHRERRYSLKLGYTPDSVNSYVLSYQYQEGEKGVPAYLGEDPFQRIRYWQFPEISKHGLHFNSSTLLWKKLRVQSRLFYDDYYSELSSYDDSTFTSQNFGSSFTSIYDDQTLGEMFILSMEFSERHELKGSFHAIYDHHREHNTIPETEEVRHFKDLTYSYGLEDHMSLTDNISLVMGAAYHRKKNLQADDYSAEDIVAFPEHADQSLNVLSAIEAELPEGHQLRANVSRKTRFPTLKDRYSYRLGRSIPNPDLSSETSWNYDLSYAYIPSTALQMHSSIYYSKLTNTIQAVYGVDPENAGVYQFQNTGAARFYGFEARLEYRPASFLELLFDYGYVKQENLDNPDIKFTNVPGHALSGQVQYTLFSVLDLSLRGMYNSSRISTSDGQYKTDGFFSADLKASYSLGRDVSLFASLTNIMDANYFYVEGYPAPGRQLFLGLRYEIRAGQK